MKEAFALLDENNDGHLSKNELRSLLVGIGESVDDDVLNEMMALADLDGDGKPDLVNLLINSGDVLYQSYYIRTIGKVIIMKHSLIEALKQNNKIKCEICNMELLKSSMDKHILTKRHIRNENKILS